MCNHIIFARGHQSVNLLLRYLHENRAHCSYKSLVYESRKRFWIVGVRNMAKQVTGKCTTCKKLRSQPLEQMMGQIPRLYVAAGFPAFSNTAIHMFGPLQIRIGSKILKVALVIIFTCMTTETVYLELVTHRSSDTLLMAFRRFASLRGHPSNCLSDRGTNFVGAQSYLNEILQGWDIPKIQNVLSEEFLCPFHWGWNIPRASHQNGVVESLVKPVRQALDASSKIQNYTEEQGRTYLAEMIYLINGSPLYPSSVEI